MPKDYYQILGVGKNASKDEIKRAFHKLAHQYHPDKKGGNESKFKEVNEAYQVLSDDRKRQQYDAYGATGPAGAGFNAGGPGTGWDFSGFTNGEGGFEFDLGDIFGDFFGGRRSQRQRGRDISVDIQIPFAEAVFGTERVVLINKIGLCPECAGSGAKTGTKTRACATCHGRGRIRETRQSFLGSFTSARECPTCRGRGEVPEEACPACGGYGTKKQTEEIQVSVPPGIEDGEMIRFSGQGEAVSGGIAGDLYVRVHVERHPTLRRDGFNLVMDLPVKWTDAILGAEYPVKMLDSEISVKIPEGVSHGDILRVRGRGVPQKPGRRGDLHIRLVIKTPAKLSKKASQLIRELKEEGI